MPSSIVLTAALLERLGREEQQLKFLGLHGHAAGVRAAITILLRLADEPAPQSQSLDPST